MIDLAIDYLNLVKNILVKYLPGNVKIWVFGSRIKGTAKQFSDLDLAIDFEQAIAKDVWVDIKIAFDQSELPIKVDLVELNKIDKSFKDIIDKEKELLIEV
jgi:predicted nucleotidyltransferase